MIFMEMFRCFKDPKQREELCEELKMVEIKARNRSVGNIRSYRISLNLFFSVQYFIFQKVVS